MNLAELTVPGAIVLAVGILVLGSVIADIVKVGIPAVLEAWARTRRPAAPVADVERYNAVTVELALWGALRSVGIDESRVETVVQVTSLELAAGRVFDGKAWIELDQVDELRDPKPQPPRRARPADVA